MGVETWEFYETQLEQLTSKVRMESDCAGSQEPRLGLCKNPKSKLTLSCHDETTLEVVVTVDLASTKSLKSTEEARSIVRRSATDLMMKVTAGKIQAQGVDMKMYSMAGTFQFREPEVICPEGSINSTSGCTPCPPGTYLSRNKCEFCPLHHYQGNSGQTSCYECVKDRGTTMRGSQHVSNCKVVRESVSKLGNNLMLYLAIGGGAILLITLACVIFFFVRRTKNNKIKKQKKEEQRRRRQQEMEMKSMRRAKHSSASHDEQESTIPAAAAP